MIIEQNRESADALYQLARYLPITMGVMSEQTQRLINTYLSVQDEIGPHREAFMEMLKNIRDVINDTSDTVDELVQIFTTCADRIMEIENSDVGHGQPQLILKKRS